MIIALLGHAYSVLKINNNRYQVLSCQNNDVIKFAYN